MAKHTDSLTMPILIPIPIRTKGQPPLIKLWRWITAVRRWEVADDWEYDLPDGTTTVIPKGFVFDGASIPKPLWGILSPTGLLLIPGLIHDFAYRYNYLWVLDEKGYVDRYRPEGAGRDVWDPLFLKVGMAVNNMYVINAIAFIAVKTMGSFAWRKNQNRKDGEIYPNKTRNQQNLRTRLPVSEHCLTGSFFMNAC